MGSISQIQTKLSTYERPKASPPRPILIPDDIYEAVLECWRLSSIPGEKKKGYEKLELHWNLMYQGEQVRLRQFFNVSVTKKGLHAGWSSNLMRNYASVFGYPLRNIINPDDDNHCIVVTNLNRDISLAINELDSTLNA